MRGETSRPCLNLGNSQEEPAPVQQGTSISQPSQAANVAVQLPLDKLASSLPSHRGMPYKPVVLVSCGSFNPPTVMHLRMFEVATQHLAEAGYNVLGGYLSPVNDAYGKAGLLPAQHRIAMAQAAVESSATLMVDAWEAEQPEYQRTLHVLRRVAQALEVAFAEGHHRWHQPLERVRVMLLCGSDLVETFYKPGAWKSEQLRQILDEHGVVCLSRKVATSESLRLAHRNLTLVAAANIIHVQEPVVNEISSSKLRDELSQGHSIKYLTTDAVIEYIKKWDLYNPHQCNRAHR